MILVASKRNGGSWTLWALPVRKEVTHSRALSRIPALLRRERRVWWQMVQEDEGRGFATVQYGSDVVVGGGDEGAFGAVVAAESGLGMVQGSVLLWEAVLSMTFAGKGSREIGRKFLRSFGSAFWFFEEGFDLGMFPALQVGGRLEGAVDDLP
ncbi:hypothetical protein NDU88_004892 [Pleurodeles waltl]|uniref:Uncharacterized protein n=1 Tax=Pleurodeles waltl TaxID=8319 RepID=A0AAV7MBB2_PLEWA|nr:hypothetical protein NDU88_004892 [Pleurodeles waltl]